MADPLGNLQQLEKLVKRQSEILRAAWLENSALKIRLERLESEHKRLKEELRETKGTLSRHDRLKARLVKLSEKLEKIG